MSTINTIITPSKVYMMTDAATYDARTGILKSIAPKAFRIGNINAAFSSRGTDVLNILLEKYFDALPAKSYDDLRRNYINKAADEIDAIVNAYMGGRGYEVVIAGWSDERDAGEVLAWQTTGKWDHLPVGKIGVYFDGILTCGTEPEKFEGIEKAEDFCPVKHGIPAIEHARRMSDDLSLGELPEPVIGHGIGGYIQLTTVTRRGVTREKIHEWPDVVGERIDPFAFDVIEEVAA